MQNLTVRFNFDASQWIQKLEKWMTAHATVQLDLLWGYSSNFILSGHLEVLILYPYVCAKFFAHPVKCASSWIHLLICWFIHSFVHSFIRSFIHLYICLLTFSFLSVILIPNKNPIRSFMKKKIWAIYLLAKW